MEQRVPFQKRALFRTTVNVQTTGTAYTGPIDDFRTDKMIVQDYINIVYDNASYLHDRMKEESSVSQKDLYDAFKYLIPLKNKSLAEKVAVITKATSGYYIGDKKSDEKAKKLIRKQRSATVSNLGFSEYSSIIAFNKKISNVVRDSERLVLECGVVSTAKETIGINLPELWKETMSFPELRKESCDGQTDLPSSTKNSFEEDVTSYPEVG
ncbi:MAG: hypothetical protein ACI9S8_001056 [Chlamydiales bacterium]|jgi:hypothetical protein